MKTEVGPGAPGASGGRGHGCGQALPTLQAGICIQKREKTSTSEAPSWWYFVTTAAGLRGLSSPRRSAPWCGAAWLLRPIPLGQTPGLRGRRRSGHLMLPKYLQVKCVPGRALWSHRLAPSRGWTQMRHGCPPAQSSQAKGTSNVPQATWPPASHTRSPSSPARQSLH